MIKNKTPVPPRGGGRKTDYEELRTLAIVSKGEPSECAVYPLTDEVKVRSAANYLARTKGYKFITRTDKEESTFTIWRKK
jgi:hypothetical protein